MGKIDLPVSMPSPSTQADTPPKAEGFSIDKSKLLSLSSESTPLVSPSDEGLELISMKRTLGLDLMDEKYNHEVRGIVDWGKEQGLDDKELALKIKEIRYKLGASNDESAAKMVYHWLKLDGQIKSLVQKQRMIEYVK